MTRLAASLTRRRNVGSDTPPATGPIEDDGSCTAGSGSFWRSRRGLTLVGTLLIGAYLLAFRGYDLSGSYALLGEQVRDWGIAQRSFTDLPLIGPRSINSGLDIGPVYYWVLWAGRKALTPLLGPLPHVGGWAVAAFQSVADVALVAVLARVLGSWWLAAAVVVLAGTTTLDASLSAVVWNPPIAEAFAKFAIAALLWPSEPTIRRSAVTLLMAICAVQSHSTAIFVAAPVSVASLYSLFRQRGASATVVAASVAAAAIAAWASLYSFQGGSVPPEPPRSSKVLSSVAAVLTNPGEHLRPLGSADAVATALEFLYLDPFTGTWPRWLFLASAVFILVRVRQITLLAASIGPPLAAVAAFSLWQGRFGEAYWFMTMLPATTVGIGVCLSTLPATARKAATLALLLVTVAVQPVRERRILSAYRQPAYGPLAKGVMAAAGGRAVRDIRPAFSVPPGMDVLFMYSLAGGALDAASDVVVMIEDDGEIRYVSAQPEGMSR